MAERELIRRKFTRHLAGPERPEKSSKLWTRVWVGGRKKEGLLGEGTLSLTTGLAFNDHQTIATSNGSHEITLVQTASLFY